MQVAIAGLLTVIAVLTRLVPHPPNMVAIGAVALFAGARLPRLWALLLPVVAMVASDILLDWGRGYSPLQGDYLARYAAFALIVLLGRLLQKKSGPFEIGGFSLLASTLFFLITNFAVWAFPNPTHPLMYSRGLDGLMASYAAGLAFFNGSSFFFNGMIADLLGVTVLFGCDAAVRWFVARHQQLGTSVETQ